MNIREWIIPQDKIFFELLEEESKKILEGAKFLFHLVNDYKNIASARKKIKDIEHESDEIVHEIYQKLNNTFITPIDKEDMTRLASLYDDVLDLIFGVVNRFYLFSLVKTDAPMKKFASIILRQVTALDRATRRVKKMDQKEIGRKCIEAHRLENLGDSTLNQAIADLFKEKDPIEIIKKKEIYEFLEKATDTCEDVANTIREIVGKYS